MGLFKSETIVSPNIVGATSGAAAAAGSQGEVISAIKAVGSPVSLTTATAANVTSVALTAGDWDVEANVNFIGTSATTAAGGAFTVGISTTTATLPTDGSEVQLGVPAVTTTSFKDGISVSRKTITVSTTTTVYLVALGTFSAGTLGAYGAITARRVR